MQNKADDPSLDEHIHGILGRGGRMFLATSCGGLTSGATVFYAPDGDDLVFFTFNPTRKAEQIRANPRVQAAVWPAEHDGIRGLQIEGRCAPITDEDSKTRARRLILGVTEAFKAYMDDPFLSEHNVTGYYRLRPTTIKLVDFHSDPQFRYRRFPEHEPSPLADALGDIWHRFGLWVRALRMPFFTATLVPVLLGAAIAATDLPPGVAFDWGLFWLVLGGAIAAHAGTNLANDYGDHVSGNDEINRTPSPFNGGSRVIQAALLAPWKIAFAALVCYAITVLCGLVINTAISGQWWTPTPVLVIGVAGVALGAAYTLGPFRLAYQGLGEIAVALGFGPLIVLGTHYVLTAGRPWHWFEPLAASLPVAALTFLIIWINQFQDVPADQAAGKRTLVVQLSRQDGTFNYRRPFRVYERLALITVLLIAGLAVLPLVSEAGTGWALMALVPLVIQVFAIRRGRTWLQEAESGDIDWQRHPYRLLPVNAATIATHFATGTLLVLAWLAA